MAPTRGEPSLFLSVLDTPVPVHVPRTGRSSLPRTLWPHAREIPGNMCAPHEHVPFAKTRRCRILSTTARRFAATVTFTAAFAGPAGSHAPGATSVPAVAKGGLLPAANSIEQ